MHPIIMPPRSRVLPVMARDVSQHARRAEDYVSSSAIRHVWGGKGSGLHRHRIVALGGACTYAERPIGDMPSSKWRTIWTPLEIEAGQVRGQPVSLTNEPRNSRD